MTAVVVVAVFRLEEVAELDAKEELVGRKAELEERAEFEETGNEARRLSKEGSFFFWDLRTSSLSFFCSLLAFSCH